MVGTSGSFAERLILLSNFLKVSISVTDKNFFLCIDVCIYYISDMTASLKWPIVPLFQRLTKQRK